MAFDWPPRFNSFQRQNFAIGDIPDLRLKVGDNNVFAVHKSVLADACPAILNLLPSGNSTLEIKSMPEAVRAMLQFIYEDAHFLPYEEKIIVAVWDLADTYGMLELQRECEADLFLFSFRSYFRFAGYATRMRLPDQLEYIIHGAACTYAHDTLVFDSEWDALKADYPETALQLLEAAVKVQILFSDSSEYLPAWVRMYNVPVPVIAPLIPHATPFEIPVQWRISDFQHLLSTFQPDQFIVCPQKFNHQSLPGVVWELILYPNGTSVSGAGHVAVSMRLRLNSNKKSQATAPIGGFSLRFEPFIGPVNANVTSAPPPQQTLAVQQILVSDEPGIAQFAHQPLVTEHCVEVDGSATLKGSILVAPPVGHNEAVSLRNLFESGIESDVTIRVDHESFAVHKCILSLSSPGMRMFGANYSELINGLIEIKETTVEAVRALLQFWYGDPLCFDGSLQLAMDVYKLANLYQDFELRQICEDALLRMASREQVLLFAAFAAVESSERLQLFTSRFIAENAHNIFRSDEWARIKAEDFKLALEICEVIVMKYAFARP